MLNLLLSSSQLATGLSGPRATWRTVLVQARLPALLLHVLLFAMLYSMLYCFGIVDHLPEPGRLLSWDAGIFRDVAENGYDKPELGKNAFFPLFPYVWRYAQLGAVGISLVNGSCALLGASIMAYTFRLSSRQVLLVVSLPMMMFTLVPYAEGFMFLFGTLLLRGLHRRNLALTLLMLLLGSLTRSAATIFVPSFVFAEMLTWSNTGPLSQRTWVRLGTGLPALATAMGLVMYLQYTQTGDALAFYHVHALWNHVFVLPTFPLNSSAGVGVLWIDAAALLLALVATVVCLGLGCWWLWRLTSPRGRRAGAALPVSGAALFALSFCVGAGAFIVFYQGGDLVGLSRYILASPFAGVVLWQLWQLRPASGRLLAAAAVACLIISLALGIPFRLDNFMAGEALWYGLLFSCYIFAYLFSAKGSSPWYREIAMGLYLVNLVVVAYLYNMFLDGTWVN